MRPEFGNTASSAAVNDMHNNEPSFVSKSGGRKSKFPLHHRLPSKLNLLGLQLHGTSLSLVWLILDVDVHACLKQELSTARVLAKDHPQCFHPSKHAKKACKAIHVSLYNVDRPIREVVHPYSLLSTLSHVRTTSLYKKFAGHSAVRAF
jgi:hypothetical protein